MNGISDMSQTTAAGNTLYSWNAPNSPVLYDRTYAITNGKQYGYFLYVDASDESRQIALIDFKADLCSGARLIFSAAVTDFTASSAPVEPQVLFKIYGISWYLVSGVQPNCDEKEFGSGKLFRLPYCNR